ncbi:MAG: DUF4040 family protein [Corynebacterium sp.]|nr:DUF4040 family protein [Corynebacterium sp.]
MSLIIVLGVAVVAIALSPILVRLIGSRAGYPLGMLAITDAILLSRELPRVFVTQDPITATYTWVPDLLGTGSNIGFDLRLDGLAAFFALLALIIGAIVFIYSAAYLPKNGVGITNFYTLMTTFMAAVLLLVFADDVFLLFIAWELVSLASFMLIARSGGAGGEAGSQRTLILTFIGGLTLLVALCIAATQAGTTNINGILHAGFWGEKPGLTATLAVLVALSAFTKAAQFPFHFWLPEAMAAITPVSAFLHAAAVVKAGIYVLLRFSTVFHDVAAWNYLLIIVGMFTAIMAALFAIGQTDLKRLTAYSTVSHLGWIVATIGVGTPVALAAALVHTLSHALFKSSLFMLVGVIDHQTGTRDINRLGSSWRQLPYTFISTTVACAAMSAVPPTFGFVSKESMLAAFEQAPLSTTSVIVLLGAATIGAILTFTYSARIVADGFIDGKQDMSKVKEAPFILWFPAALPGLISLPLVFAMMVLDEPINNTIVTITNTDPQTHLALWHGVNTPLLLSILVLVIGGIGVRYRLRIWNALTHRNLLPFDGNHLLKLLLQGFSTIGKTFGRMADTLSPARHLALLFGLFIAFGAVVGIAGLVQGGVDGVPLDPRVPGTNRITDLLPLAIIVISVFAIVRSPKRLTAVACLGITGVGVTLQVLMLGAPDVALTQFLVESLTVVIMMLVVRQQPANFHPEDHRKSKVVPIVVAVGFGVVTFLGTYMLVGRHERSALAMWYLENGPKVTEGDNVVNTILVEFRAFDTMGELSVLGMAAIVMAAVVTSMPRYPFLKGTHPAPIGHASLNTIPMKTLLRIMLPALGVLSALIFWRGHNSPGGGFIAALVAGGALMLVYFSFGHDRRIVKVNVPVVLTGCGILTAVFSGVLGLLKGSFLFPIHGHFLGQHLTTSMIFDAGVYLAVLGMLSMAVNVLGGYLRPGMEYQDLNFNRTNSPLQSLKVVELDAEQHKPVEPESPEHKRIVAQARRDAALLKLDSKQHIAQIVREDRAARAARKADKAGQSGKAQAGGEELS